ncbi:MAG TPA: hypothetical protein VJU84_13885 [Pyrinomonadaceae bacterium]|nr:hypothetical protein [Pyrinomonadaceae bacterium]
MDRVTGIIRYQWRAYWRRFSRAKSLTAGNQGITLIITAVLFFKWISLLGAAATSLSAGDTKLFQTLLTAILFAWLFLPVSAAPSGVPLQALLHLPLSIKALFAIRIAALVMTPYSWIVLAASFAISYPLAHAVSPLAGMAAALLLITMSGLIGVTLAHLVNIGMWRRLLIVFLLVSAFAAFFLGSENDSRSLQVFRYPIDLVTNAALGRNRLVAISLLLIMNLILVVIALSSLKVHLQTTPGRRSRRKTSSMFRLPTAVGSLAAKDVRYFRTLLDPYLGLLVSALGFLYLVTSDSPLASIAWAFTVILFLPNSPLAFNSFGLDSPAALERYALMPASGETVVRAKNLAFVILCSLQVAPIILLTYLRLGLSAGTFGLVLAISTAAAYLLWGNWMSISLPFKMYPYRFTSTTGALPELMAGIFFGSLPGILAFVALRSNGIHQTGLAALVLVPFVLLYMVGSVRSGRRFDRQRERIALSLKLR